MKFSHIPFVVSAFVAFLFCCISCEDDNPTIGSVISSGEVNITIDTITYNLEGKALRIESFDSKTGNLMIGRIQNDNYGKLNCSFVTRLMCAPNLQIPDSLFNLDNFVDRVDSCKLILGAQRNEIVGDSLAPQILTVYKLNKALPQDIDNTFDASSYYDSNSPLASRSYTISEISNSDSTFYNNSYVDISLSLPVEFGREIITKYKENPSIFQWPNIMAEKFPLPGFFVQPTFGNGCVANITSVYVGVFYHSLKETTTVVDKDTTIAVTHVNNLVVPFTVSPEVLSSNNISYIPSQNIINQNNLQDGNVVITSPGGYIAQFSFPAQDLIERYKKQNTHLSTVNDLQLFIPATSFDETAGFGMSENILMVKSSEYEEFFQKNKIPDNKISFTGVYDSTKKRYYFSGLRAYFLELLSKDYITDEDITFTLVPVEITTETVKDFYGNGSTYVTKCVPYVSKPTMTLLNTVEATIAFSFSTQVID